MSEKWTEERMQNALVERGNLFDFTRYAVVPNVSYAVLQRGEADLLCLSKSGTFHEVEIKVSRTDLRADAKKRFGHQNSMVSYTWFAVPVELEPDAIEIVPKRYGIVVVDRPHALSPKAWLRDRNETRVVRPAKRFLMPGARKPTDAEIIKFLRTGVIRMWSKRKGAEA